MRSACSSWFGASRGGENTCFASSKLGKVCVTAVHRDPPTELEFSQNFTIFDEVGLRVGFVIEVPHRGKMVLLKGG